MVPIEPLDITTPPSMIHSIRHCSELIDRAKDLQRSMVGNLYPTIIQAIIERLEARRMELIDHQAVGLQRSITEGLEERRINEEQANRAES